MVSCDFLVIGGGIAGLSVASWLAEHGQTVVLEREAAPAYHATGRSAALYTEHYGNPLVRALTRVSGRFLRHPPPGFVQHPILTPRGVLFLARPDQEAALARLEREMREAAGTATPLSVAETLKHVPVLDPAYLSRSLLDASAMDIDVHGLVEGYRKRLIAHGGRLATGAELTRLVRRDGVWHAATAVGDFTAPVVLNAAGAWSDQIATLARLAPLGLAPLRRTAVTFAAPPGLDVGGWPAVIDVDEQFYMKPEAGRLLASPADETPSPPCDAQADELEVAIAVDRIERATTLKIARIAHRWAGLRTFAPDRSPAVGFDPEGEGFFWLAGQGGYGVQNSAALGRVAAALVRGAPLPADCLAEGISEAQLSPLRLRPALK